MNNEVLSVKYINAKNCFLYLSAHYLRSLLDPKVCCLKLITSDGRELYFSSSPTPSPLVDSNSVGISQPFAKKLDIKENECVIISPLYNLGSLQSINVTPVSEDDFEILHSSALSIETSLLSQLRIVWPKQVFLVWVSANISVTLVVDSISPNIKYGRLEEYSEVIVATVKPKNGIRKTNKTLDKGSGQPKNFNEEVFVQKRITFRCVPREDLFGEQCRLKYHPYLVFTRTDSLPDWATKVIDTDKNVVWRVKKYGDDGKWCVVRIVFDDAVPEPEEIPGFRMLFVSPLLKSYIGVDLGHKVVLELLRSEKNVDITGVMVSPPCEKDEKFIDEIHNTFFQAISTYGDILLNTKAPYPVIGGENALLTLRPLDTNWGFISQRKLAGLNITVNKFVAEQSSQAQVEKCLHFENLIPSFKDILEQGRISLEISLGLHSKDGIKRFSDNLIFTGRSGCGKSKLVKMLSVILNGPPFYVYTKYVSCCSLKGKRIEALSKYFTEILQNCYLHEPSVLILDDLDLLASISEENTEAAFHINRVSHKIVEMIEAHQRKHSILIVATAKSLDHINPHILSSKGKCLFSTAIKIPNLSNDDRLEFIKKTLQGKSFQCEDDVDYNGISLQTEGYTPLDLKKFCDKVIFEAWQRKNQDSEELSILNKDIEFALKTSKPSSLHQVNFYKGPKSSWKDIGGLKIVKEKLIEVVCWSTMYPDIIGQCPVKPQTGVLIYGAPGTGKTLIAGALATESRMNFISIKGPELMSKYIGESEEGVRKLFEKAQAAKPCLLFFDEFDSLAPRRGQDQTGVTDRVVNQLLTALDGVDPMSGVWVLAATSRPDLIDPAVLRPGRIGISIQCPLPDQADRLEIISSLCSKTSLSNDIDINELSELTEGYTGADIKGLFTSAQIKAIDLLLDENGQFNADPNSENDSLPAVVLKKEHILSALKELKPSLSEAEKRRYQTIYDQFERHVPVKIQEQKVTHA